MEIIEVAGGYVLGFTTKEEAQAVLEETLKSNKDARIHESLSDYIERIVGHLKLRGIDPAQPLPGPFEEVSLPAGVSSSYAAETIVPTKTPIAYAPVPRTAPVAVTQPGKSELDEHGEIVGEPVNAPVIPAPVAETPVDDTWQKEKT